MKCDAIITVRAEAEREGAGPEKSTYTVGGAVEQTASGWRATYDEPVQSGMERTVTALDVSDARAELTRTGFVRCRFVFVPGETIPAAYKTPYGTMDALVHTIGLRTRTSAGGALLELKYELELEGAKSRHRLSIRVKRAEGGTNV